jgi:hypothetical protein
MPPWDGIPCLSGQPPGKRHLTEGCPCEFCRRNQDKNAPRDVTLQDVVRVASRHHNCRGNILNAMLTYKDTGNPDQRLYESGFTNAEIKAGRVALDTACRFVDKLKALGYKWDPTLGKPIAPTVK